MKNKRKNYILVAGIESFSKHGTSTICTLHKPTSSNNSKNMETDYFSIINNVELYYSENLPENSALLVVAERCSNF
jgi:hypothetical protein